jgi:hypothetical protein
MSPYKERIAKGLCGKCGAANNNGSSLCDSCKEKERKRATVKRAKNAAAGKCINCGSPVSTRSKTKCDNCLDGALRSVKSSRQKRKAVGKCQSCGQRDAMPGKTVCKPCSQRMTDFRMKQYAEFKAAGLCPGCGREPVPGYKQCQKCRDKDTADKARYKQAAIDGYGGPICVGCGCKDYEILEIDHIGGGGCKHRREIGMGNNIYRWLAVNNFPPGFRVLCPTCNKKAHKGIPLPKEG